MTKRRFHRSVILFLVGAFIVAGLCPSICEAAQSHTQSYSCCSDSGSSETSHQQSSKHNDENCCQDSLFTTNKTISTENRTQVGCAQIMSPVQNLWGAQLGKNQILACLSEAVPKHHFGLPIYLSKQSFLI